MRNIHVILEDVQRPRVFDAHFTVQIGEKEFKASMHAGPDFDELILPSNVENVFSEEEIDEIKEKMATLVEKEC